MKKKFRITIVGIVLVVASAFGSYWMQQYLTRSRASATAPTVSFTVAGPKVNPGDIFDLTIAINPNLTPFYSFDVAFTYDAAKVELFATDPANLTTSITPLSTKSDGVVDITLLKGIASTSVNVAAHTVRITGIRTTGASDPFIGRDPIQMVKVSFVLKPGQELPLDFKWIDPEPGKISISDSFEKKDFHYTGEEPTPTAGPTGVAAVGVPTSTPVPQVTPTQCTNNTTCPTGYTCFQPPMPTCPAGKMCTQVMPSQYCKSLTVNAPTPTITFGGAGVEGTTTTILPGKDLLYINSIATYPAPFRYEQAMKLERGTYRLTIGAKVYVKRGRGMVVAFVCNEADCGTNKKKGDPLYVSPVFPAKAGFSEMVVNPVLTEEKNYVVRVYCEDGSECEIDYISLEDAWGSERLQNTQFASSVQSTNPRKQPASWEIDPTANLYGSVDSAVGKNGSLMINNSAK